VRERVRVVIADDHRLFREGLRELLASTGIEVLGEASNGNEAVALASELAPDVVVLDLNMPGAPGLDALRAIVRTMPAVRTVILTVSAEEGDVVEALAAGACGYMLKDTRLDLLAEGIRQAAEGHMLVSGEVAQALRARVRASVDAAGAPAEHGGAPAREELLTPREVDVLRLIAEGADNVAIGLALSISPHTVKQYVTNIFEKLGVRSRVQAAVYAVRAGLV